MIRIPEYILKDVISILRLNTPYTGHLLTEYLNKNEITLLNLSDCKLSEIDIKNLCIALAQNKTVTWLDLSFNDLSSESAQTIAEMLQKNHHIIYVNLSHNNIDPCAALSIKQAIMENIGLDYLDLSDNALKDTGVNVIMDGIANSEHKLMQGFTLNLNNNQCSPLKEETLEKDLLEAFIQNMNFFLTPRKTMPLHTPVQNNKTPVIYNFSKELGKVTFGVVTLAASACYAYSQFKKNKQSITLR